MFLFCIYSELVNIAISSNVNIEFDVALFLAILMIMWVKVFKNGPSIICGRQPLKYFTWSIVEYLDPTFTIGL